jgi:hypothetical protein
VNRRPKNLVKATRGTFALFFRNLDKSVGTIPQ